jgi:hypothetical protein
MTKPPEEGKIWEWRAFGRVDDQLAERVRAYPVRMGISDLHGEDVYLVSPNNDQNVKLRRYASGWVLKLKPLLETEPGGFELYFETAEFSYLFPVQQATLENVARLLELSLPDVARADRLDETEFVGALLQSSPPVTEARVTKRRSQYQFDGGWLEVADVRFASLETQSISIHSPDIERVKEMLVDLNPGGGLEPMNYIAACRRWGRAVGS